MTILSKVEPTLLGEVKQFALSLTGEPIAYPKINEICEKFHSRGISTFIVTNAQFPEQPVVERLHVRGKQRREQGWRNEQLRQQQPSGDRLHVHRKHRGECQWRDAQPKR